MPHQNDMRNIPAAACSICGGWTSRGGMSQHSDTKTPVIGRTGCTGPHNVTRSRYAEQLEMVQDVRVHMLQVLAFNDRNGEWDNPEETDKISDERIALAYIQEILSP